MLDLEHFWDWKTPAIQWWMFGMFFKKDVIMLSRKTGGSRFSAAGRSPRSRSAGPQKRSFGREVTGKFFKLETCALFRGPRPFDDTPAEERSCSSKARSSELARWWSRSREWWASKGPFASTGVSVEEDLFSGSRSSNQRRLSLSDFLLLHNIREERHAVAVERYRHPSLDSTPHATHWLQLLSLF